MVSDETTHQGEWLDANEALIILTIDGANRKTVKDMLADYLRDGLLKAKARAVWISEEASLSRAWKDETIRSGW